MLIMSCSGQAAKVFSVASSLTLGKLSDIIGRFPVFVGALGLEMLPPLYLALRGVTEGGNQRGIILLLAACMGAGMSGVCVVSTATAVDRLLHLFIVCAR